MRLLDRNPVAFLCRTCTQNHSPFPDPIDRSALPSRQKNGSLPAQNVVFGVTRSRIVPEPRVPCREPLRNGDSAAVQHRPGRDSAYPRNRLPDDFQPQRPGKGGRIPCRTTLSESNGAWRNFPVRMRIYPCPVGSGRRECRPSMGGRFAILEAGSNRLRMRGMGPGPDQPRWNGGWASMKRPKATVSSGDCAAKPIPCGSPEGPKGTRQPGEALSFSKISHGSGPLLRKTPARPWGTP